MKTIGLILAAPLVSLLTFSQSITTTTLTFDALSNLSCGSTFTENNVMVSLVPTTAADCISGQCNFGGSSVNGALLLAQGRLDIDLSEFLSVQQVQIDIQTTAPSAGSNPWSSWAFLWDGTSPTFIDYQYTNTPQLTTLTLNNPQNINLTNLVYFKLWGFSARSQDNWYVALCLDGFGQYHRSPM